MVAVRLEDEALDFAMRQLEAADGGIATELQRQALWEPVVFLPDFADPLTMPALDDGGIGDADGAGAELASYLLFLKRRDGRLKSLIFDDPWASPADLDYDGPPPEELLTLDGRVHYLYDIALLSPELLWNYRARAVSFLGLIYVSEMPAEDIRATAEEAPADLFHHLAKSVRHLAVSAFDGESWLILRHERGHSGGCKPDCRCGHGDHK
jgi:hypothetical protein